MRAILLLALLLLTASFCAAQFVIHPKPGALSYLFYAGEPPRAVMAPMTDAERARFQQVYTAVLHADAALDAEADALSAQANACRTRRMAAMAKIDPAIAGSSAHPSADEILKAQAAATQADPTLQTQWDDLMQKMTAHQQKVDAAMLKLDPTLSSTFSKLSP